MNETTVKQEADVDVVDRTVIYAHMVHPCVGSVRKHVAACGSSAMRAGCCGADQKALISSLESFLALDV